MFATKEENATAGREKVGWKRWRRKRGGVYRETAEGCSWECDGCTFIVVKGTRVLTCCAAGGHRSYCLGRKLRRPLPGRKKPYVNDTDRLVKKNQMERQRRAEKRRIADGGRSCQVDDGWRWSCERCGFVAVKTTYALVKQAVGGHKSHCYGAKKNKKVSAVVIKPEILAECRKEGETPSGVKYELLMTKILDYGAKYGKCEIDQRKAMDLFLEKKLYHPVRNVMFPGLDA